MVRVLYNGQNYEGLTTLDEETGEVISLLDSSGAEILDPTPMAPPVGYKRTPSLAEQVREMVRSERLAAEAEAAGYETFEDSEDFDVEDDLDIPSQWENDYDPPISELREAVEQERASKSSPKPSPEASETQVSSAADGLD